jgi:hypothetical protein
MQHVYFKTNCWDNDFIIKLKYLIQMHEAQLNTPIRNAQIIRNDEDEETKQIKRNKISVDSIQNSQQTTKNDELTSQAVNLSSLQIKSYSNSRNENRGISNQSFVNNNPNNSQYTPVKAFQLAHINQQLVNEQTVPISHAKMPNSQNANIKAFNDKENNNVNNPNIKYVSQEAHNELKILASPVANVDQNSKKTNKAVT